MNTTDLDALLDSANSALSSATDVTQLTSELTKQLSSMDKVYTEALNTLADNISNNYVTLNHFETAMNNISLWLMFLMAWNLILTIVLIVGAVKRRRALKKSN
ncbi:hypothetical protein [Weissella soli]|uniref:hypothetical protein n=1 Tax=Weissella soli TaxID=155866 RepID=UPI001F327215|nr:hypothetical protein [Weissella soli]MCT8394691.1 hypothetical protein [Weissella soli]GJM48084.1 hypothetical protein WSSLDB02_06410 [Weissella soli]